MELTVSRPVKILAAVGVVAALALGLGMKMLGSSQASSTTAPTASSLLPKRHHRHAAKPKPARAKARAPKPAASKQVLPLIAANGLPRVVVTALDHHRVVVVSVYNPNAEVDGIAFAEARAGAALAGAAFVGISVLDSRLAGPLTTKFGDGQPLADPGILVLRAPGALATRIDGFADREAVAQAAANAARS